MSIIRSLEIRRDDNSHDIVGRFVHDGLRYRLQGPDNTLNRALLELLDYQIHAKLLTEMIQHMTTTTDLTVDKVVVLQQSLADSLEVRAKLNELATFNRVEADKTAEELKKLQCDFEVSERLLKIYEDRYGEIKL